MMHSVETFKERDSDNSISFSIKLKLLPQSKHHNFSEGKNVFLTWYKQCSVVWLKSNICLADTGAVREENGDSEMGSDWQGFYSASFCGCLSVELPPFSCAAEKPFPQGVVLSLDTGTATTLWSHCKKHMKDHSQTHTLTCTERGSV